MGCGVSKLEEEHVATLQPIRRRIDELLSRRNAGVSKKQPLLGDGADSHGGSKGGEEEEEIITMEDEMPRLPSASNDGHSFHLTQEIPPTSQKITSPIDNNCSSSSISFPKVEDKSENHSNNINIVDENKYENNKWDIVINNDEVKNLHDKKIFKELSHEEEEECTCEDLGRTVNSAGSPSFRVYCVHDSLHEEELNEVAGDDLESSGQLIVTDADKKCLRQESSSSNTIDRAKHMLKKHRRGRKFKMIAIPKGGKNILHNMHALYHFPCHSHNSHQLMQEAVA